MRSLPRSGGSLRGRAACQSSRTLPLPRWSPIHFLSRVWSGSPRSSPGRREGDPGNRRRLRRRSAPSPRLVPRSLPHRHCLGGRGPHTDIHANPTKVSGLGYPWVSLTSWARSHGRSPFGSSPACEAPVLSTLPVRTAQRQDRPTSHSGFPWSSFRETRWTAIGPRRGRRELVALQPCGVSRLLGNQCHHRRDGSRKGWLPSPGWDRCAATTA